MHGLTKNCGEPTTVAGIDFDVAPGEISSRIGPNGAGKTTTPRMVTTILRPTSGEIHAGELDALKDPAAMRHLISYLLGACRPSGREGPASCPGGRSFLLSRAAYRYARSSGYAVIRRRL